MTAVSRLGYEGYGVKRAGNFSAKTPGTAGGPHPVGIITRLALDGYGARRYSSFAGKTPDTGAGELHSLPFLVTMGRLSAR